MLLVGVFQLTSMAAPPSPPLKDLPKVEELKLMKDSMDPELYSEELERLLIELALKDRAIRERGSGR